MLSSRNEMIAVGVLIFYLAFVPGFEVVRDLLSTHVGKALALAGIIYVHKYVSCSVALLLVIGFLRCQMNAWEYMTNPTAEVDPEEGTKCPDGYAYDFAMKKCQVSSSMAGGVPPPDSSEKGASVDTPPPNKKITTAPMTTPTATMPPVKPSDNKGGVQPASGSSSSAAHV